MRKLVSRTVIAVVLTLASLSPAVAVDSLQMFVDARRGSDSATGTASDPFATIGAAVRAVRGAPGPVTINVRPGTYRSEVFPILIDSDDRTIRRVEDSTLPVKVVASPRLGAGQAMFAVIADDVSIQGLSIDAGRFEADTAFNYGIYIDTANQFSIHNIVVQGAFLGLYARRSSGVVHQSTFKLNAGSGLFVAAGTADDPAVVQASANTSTSNCIGGAGFSATVMADTPPPAGVPLSVEPVSGTLDIDLGFNDFSGNSKKCSAAGAQFFLRVGGELASPGSINANVHDNRFVDNVDDLAVDSHRAGSEDTAPSSFTGTFSNNTYSADPTKRFLGFNFRNCDGSAPVTDSLIAVTDPANELAGFVYDATGEHNTLLVNGNQLVGTNRPTLCA